MLKPLGRCAAWFVFLILLEFFLANFSIVQLQSVHWHKSARHATRSIRNLTGSTSSGSGPITGSHPSGSHTVYMSGSSPGRLDRVLELLSTCSADERELVRKQLGQPQVIPPVIYSILGLY